MKKTDGNEYGAPEAKRGGLQIIARIVCLLLAFVIWLYVVDNDSNDYEKTFTLIPIEIEGSETLAEISNMSVINLEESAVSVTVRGKRGDINKLSSEDFRAYVNVGSLTTAERHLVSVLVDLPAGVERLNTEPSAVNIYTDELAEREVPVEVVPDAGIAPDGAALGDAGAAEARGAEAAFGDVAVGVVGDAALMGAVLAGADSPRGADSAMGGSLE